MERVAHFKNADSIRGLACLIVLFVHATGWIYSSSRPYLPGTGKIGVWLFFVLSAFLLTNHLILRGISRTVLIDYLMGRLFRIVPLYVISVAIYYLLGTAGIDTPNDVAKAILLQGAYAHLWSVPVEMKFYAILPIVLAMAIPCYRRFGTISGFAMVCAIAAAWTFAHPYFNTPEYCIEIRWYGPSFLVGSAIAFIYPRMAQVISGNSKYRFTFNIATTIILLVMTDHFRKIYYPSAPRTWLGDEFLPISVLWGIFLLMNIDATWQIGKASNKILSMIGKSSYPIYLFHWLIIVYIVKYFNDTMTGFLMAVTFPILAGIVIHQFIETPILSMKNKIKESRNLNPGQEDRNSYTNTT